MKENTEIFDKYPDVVTVNQLCQMLGGICSKTAYHLLKQNLIKHIKIGKKYLIPKIYIIEYVLYVQNED